MLAMIAPYPITKVLQCPELKLLDCTLAASKFRGDLAQTPLGNKKPVDHPLLIVWQRLDELVKHCPLLDVVFHADLFQVIRHDFLLSGKTVPAVREYVCRDPQKPCHERQSAPFESRKARQRMVEYIRSQILCFFAVSHST